MYGLTQFQRFLPHNPQETTLPVFNPFKIFSQDDDDFKVSLFHTPYKTPSATDMLVIVPFFNPCNSVRMLQNMLLIKNKLEQSKIPFVVIHCLFPNSMPLGNESDSYTMVHSNSYAFLKENLANIVIKKYIKNYKKFLIHDSDIIFDNKSWYDDVALRLNTVDIVQPFHTYKNLDNNFVNVIREGISLFAAYQNLPRKIDVTLGHP